MDAARPVAGRRIDLATPTPGFTASVYAANNVPADIAGWSKVSEDTQVDQDERIRLDTRRKRYRYYLVWITALPEGDKAAIAELTLQR